EAMREASELVLPDFPLRTDAKLVRYPDRYSDPRGTKMWGTVLGLLDSSSSAAESPNLALTQPEKGPPILLYLCLKGCSAVLHAHVACCATVPATRCYKCV